MKHWRLFIALFLLGSLGIIVLVLYNYYTPPQFRQPYQTVHHHDDTLLIAYIGDSWAAMHKEYDARMAKMIEDSLDRPVKVQSYGICGLTSKEIYNMLFDDIKLKSILKGCSYCIISAGINDTYKKMSSTYYKVSMELIIDFMLSNHICPIIIEIPDYNIEKAFVNQKMNRKILRHLSMAITGNKIDCKESLRISLKETIEKNTQNNVIDIINYQEWNYDYKRDLRVFYTKDGMHLNEAGYSKLDRCIANHIISIENYIRIYPNENMRSI
jgi:lysophospholipase L1-like esterase